MCSSGTSRRSRTGEGTRGRMGSVKEAEGGGGGAGLIRG